jgi:hypothetical protein
MRHIRKDNKMSKEYLPYWVLQKVVQAEGIKSEREYKKWHKAHKIRTVEAQKILDDFEAGRLERKIIGKDIFGKPIYEEERVYSVDEVMTEINEKLRNAVKENKDAFEN